MSVDRNFRASSEVSKYRCLHGRRICDSSIVNNRVVCPTLYVFGMMMFSGSAFEMAWICEAMAQLSGATTAKRELDSELADIDSSEELSRFLIAERDSLPVSPACAVSLYVEDSREGDARAFEPHSDLSLVLSSRTKNHVGCCNHAVPVFSGGCRVRLNTLASQPSA